MAVVEHMDCVAGCYRQTRVLYWFSGQKHSFTSIFTVITKTDCILRY